MAKMLSLPKLGGIGSSPVLIAGVAGAALVAVVWISARNRPASEVVGGTLPFDWDALRTWFGATNGGPGAPVPPVPATEDDGNPPDPNPGPDPPVPGPPYSPPPTIRDCYGPNNRPWPCPPGPQSILEPDEMETEQPLIPTGVGGGAQRVIGFTPETLHEAQYNIFAAYARAEHKEDRG